MRLFLVFIIILALWYYAKKESKSDKVEHISEVVGDGKGKINKLRRRVFFQLQYVF